MSPVRRLAAPVALGTALVGLALLAAGCWDRQELENTAWVLAMGIDPAEEDHFVFTFRVAVPRLLPGGGAGGAGDEAGRTFTTAILARTGFEALDLFNTYISRRISLRHLRAIIVSEEVARAGQLEGLVDALIRFREYRRTVFLLVARGPAAPILEAADPLLAFNISTFLDNLHGQRAFHGLAASGLLHDFVLSAESPAEAPVQPLLALGRQPGGLVPGEPGQDKPQPSGTDLQRLRPRGTAVLAGEAQRAGGASYELMGAAVFSGYRMVGTLNGDETRLLSMLRGTFRRTFVAVPDPLAPGRWVTVELRMERGPRVSVRRDGDRTAIDVQMALDAGLVSVRSQVDYFRGDNLRLLEAAVADRLRQEGQALIRRSQEEFGADIFRFGDAVRATFLRSRDWEAFDWPDKFPQADVRLAVEVAIRRQGFLREPPPLPPGGGG